MPLREYHCPSCGQDFEELVRGDEDPACPGCGKAGAERRLSAFATLRSPAPAPAAGPCGSCGDPRGPGACALDA